MRPTVSESSAQQAPPSMWEEPTIPLSPMQIFWYSVASLGCGAFFSFNTYVLPLFLRHYTHNAILLGLMGSSHSAEGAIIQPIVGNASDRLQSPWGRRRPFMLVSFLLSALILLITPAAGILPGGLRLGAIVLCIFLFTVLFNIGFDPYQALMPDITPIRQRGHVTGVWALFGNFAQCAILLMPLLLAVAHWAPRDPQVGFALQFLIVGVFMIVTTVLTCVTIREKPGTAAIASSKGNVVSEIRNALRGLRTLRQAAIAMIVFAVSGAGIGAVLPYLSLFVQAITGCNDDQAQLMGFVLLFATMLAVMPFGWLVDRIGATKVVYLSFILIGFASLGALFIHTLLQVAVVMALAGVGNAAQAASIYPLLTELVPREEVGFYTGFQSTMLSISQPLAVVLTGWLINQGHGSYRVIFMVCAATMIVAIVVLTRVDQTRIPEEIQARMQELGSKA